MMVMQYWQLPEGPSEQASQLDSIRLLQGQQSPGVIVHSDRRGHTLEEELKQAIEGAEASPQIPSGASTLNDLEKLMAADGEDNVLHISEQPQDPDESRMLAEDSRVAESLEELMAEGSPIIPAINEVLRGQRSDDFGSQYINIVEEMEPRGGEVDPLE